MSKPFCILLLLFLAASQISAQHVPTIEDTIAGVTVGKSSFGAVQRRFGNRLTLVDGRHAVRWDGECEIFFDLEKDDSDRPDNRVRNIQLLNLGKGSDHKSPCNKLTTGRGLRLSDSPDRVRVLYGPAKVSIRNKMNAAGYNSRPPCSKRSTRRFLMRDMGVEWAPGSSGLQNIYLGVTSTTCDEWGSN